ncbi:MAG TPA: hypothetical protein PKD68_04825 [Candidatus Saccharibacteria bacterium]|nr:hypothetical protein [Candidatus Saccharibacteria bacterium]
MKKLLTASLVLATLSTAILLATPVNAATCMVNGKPVETSILDGTDCAGTGSSGSSITAILLYILNFMAIGVGIAVVAGISWGGFMYAQAGGDSAKTKQAVSIIINAVIGLVLFIFMWALVNFMVPGGVFT